MSAVIIDGKALAAKIKDKVKEDVEALVRKQRIIPHLAVILIGSDPASQTYVRGKEKACEKVGIKSTVIKREIDITEAEILDLIDELNEDKTVHGILLQLPIPKHLDANKIISRIDPTKDVDGFTPTNVAKLTSGYPGLVPCTPLGIMKILDEYNIQIEGKRCVVIGRSQIVGKPMALLLLKANGTVTICHSKTKELEKVAKEADILVAATGKPKMVDINFVKKGAVLIDVGISKVDDKLLGDIDFESVKEVAGYITPVPGGVGPMTIACLLENTVSCYKSILGEKS
ncbi:MAG: bifunctional methylenetetrahydrofolate dehydrogenase/methenyltetrahydrofolate cyclohydrolase FolD [Bacilli bacterium]|nr:bifunctional methylenetetrahydrofolate dehydrogenase/methenyltetrahydrofolate cyclohydrolase FolD [Bacilli bacterium]MBN2696950.1 bifunctional methylenetetrahydrofolate dehydrogenase/methenyltetrahydrofolate cyclohydrolase FolD [Bacilli bacterium]